MAITSPTLNALRNMLAGNQVTWDPNIFKSAPSTPEPSPAPPSGSGSVVPTGGASVSALANQAGQNHFLNLLNSLPAPRSQANNPGMVQGPADPMYSGTPQPGNTNPWSQTTRALGFDPFEYGVGLPTAQTSSSGAIERGPDWIASAPGNPNINYTTRRGADEASRLSGMPVAFHSLSEDYGPAGAPSHPQYNLGNEDGLPAGQYLFWVANYGKDYADWMASNGARGRGPR